MSWEGLKILQEILREAEEQQQSIVEELLQGALETNPSAPGNATEPRKILWLSLREEGKSIHSKSWASSLSIPTCPHCGLKP